MATFTGSSIMFNSSNEKLHDEGILLISHTIQCHLYTQVNAPVVTDRELADTTPMSGGGYPGAQTLTTKAITNKSGKIWRFTADDITFTAGAGGIVDAYWWAIYTNTPVNKWLACFGRLDTVGGAVSAAEGDPIIIKPEPTDGFLLFETST